MDKLLQSSRKLSKGTGAAAFTAVSQLSGEKPKGADGAAGERREAGLPRRSSTLHISGDRKKKTH